MSLLHALFHSKDFRGFQRRIDGSNDKKQASTGGGPGTSVGRSWTRPSALASVMSSVDVNSRDWLGRTVLHLSVTSAESIDYLKVLLKHPNINVNLADTESQWTPLHRALYHANIVAARLLLQRSDIDISLKDKEGYTAFDVYNSTISGTKPDAGDRDAELFTWGTNRNAALGFADGNDRVHPDKVVIRPKEEIPETEPLSKRFRKMHIRQIQMSKLHTAVVTSESSGNLRLCGFGSGGRLGRGQQVQYELNSLSQFEYTIVAVALGQDHTLAITKAGEVLSWGLNRFSQLGYIVETTTGKFSEPIQAVPKKILNPLRKEFVRGVAACKTASACWTAEDVYTWGTNHGQLGYDKQAHPVQVNPRKVTKFSQPIVSMVLTDNMMACLLRSQQVECIWNDRHSRVIFPINTFPPEIQPYRPPQAVKASHIAKLASSDDLVAALSANGEVFTFSPPSDHHADNSMAIRPQRIWALRKKFSSVQDVAIGPDGSILTCTESGHVYLRIRNLKGGGKNFKFQRIPHLQRITNVTANSTGAFGALRIDFKPNAIQLRGNTLAQDLGDIQPVFTEATAATAGEGVGVAGAGADGLANEADEEDQEDVDIERDVAKLRTLIGVWRRELDGKISEPKFANGADTLLCIDGLSFPVHRVIIASRSRRLLDVFISSANDIDEENLTIQQRPSKLGPGLGVTKVSVLGFGGINPLSLLVLVHYLYSDEVLALWDRRINIALAGNRLGLEVDANRVKTDLQRLARVLELPALQIVLQTFSKRAPAPTLPQNLGALFKLAQESRSEVPEVLRPNVVLEFADKDVWTHSVILHCRSPFFSALFGSDVWTVRRWDSDGVLRLDFKHLNYRVMLYVLRFMVCGEDREMFDVLPYARTVDEALEVLFEVMAPASELLLDRLLLICSTIILEYLDIHNCCYILTEATHYRAADLVDRVQEYMAANMETLLESGVLDNLPHHILQQLSVFIATKQTEKSTFTRTPVYVDSLLARHWDWLADQDIPGPVDPSWKSDPREFKTMSTLTPSRDLALSLPAPILPPLTLGKRTSEDELFAMDDIPSPQKQRSAPLTVATSSKPNVNPNAPVWKVANAPRVDMKAVIDSEAKQQQKWPIRLAPPAGVSPEKYIAKKSTFSEQQMPEKPSPPNFSSLQPSTPTKASFIKRDPNSPWRTTGDPGSLTTPPGFPTSLSGNPLPGASPVLSDIFSNKKPPPLPRSLQDQGSSTRRVGVPSQAPLGPVITPTKQPSRAAGNSIRSASGKAWTMPPPEPVKPIVRPPASTPTEKVAVLSFADIQRVQEEQLAAVSGKDKRSLREIQEEEEALQREADFLMWWGAEEERVKDEMAVLEGFQQAGKQQHNQKGQGQQGVNVKARKPKGPKSSRPSGSGQQSSIADKAGKADTFTANIGTGPGRRHQLQDTGLALTADSGHALNPPLAGSGGGSTSNQESDGNQPHGQRRRQRHRKPAQKERPSQQQ